MNILFVAHWDKKKASNIGIKLQGQVDALEQLGHTVTALRFEEGAVWAKTKEKSEKLFDVSESGFMHLLAIPKAVKYLIKHHAYNYDLCYIRKTFCTPWHLMMLRYLKKNRIITIEELPTFPYDEEAKLYPSKYKAALILDKLCRRFYHFWLDYFVTFSQHDSIFHVPTIKMENGIDIENTPFFERSFPEGEVINVLTISSMKPWHGYERLIQGLADYKVKYNGEAKKFVLHMVGDGDMRSEWENLSDSLGIKEQVIFYGNRTGKELDEIAKTCSIAVSELGDYKMEAERRLKSSSLKTREYVARGIPFIYSAKMDETLEKQDFCLYIPIDESPVNFLDVEEFYKRLVLKSNSGESCSRTMREYAEKYFSWKTQMSKVIKEIKKSRRDD